MLVQDAMTREVATLNRNDELSLADDLMRLGRIRHLPVLSEDRELVGLVSQRDLFRGALARCLGYGDLAQRRILKTIVVKEVMSSDPLVARPDEDLKRAAGRMLEGKIGCLPVVEDGVVVGILTEADFVKLALL